MATMRIVQKSAALLVILLASLCLGETYQSTVNPGDYITTNTNYYDSSYSEVSSAADAVYTETNTSYNTSDGSAFSSTNINGVTNYSGDFSTPGMQSLLNEFQTVPAVAWVYSSLYIQPGSSTGGYSSSPVFSLFDFQWADFAYDITLVLGVALPLLIGVALLGKYLLKALQYFVGISNNYR